MVPGQGDVALARLWMVRALVAWRGTAAPPHEQHKQGGARALDGPAAHVGWLSVAVGGQRHGLEGGMVVAHR